MDIAIVTGAETPLGLRLVQSLVQQGYRVHGIGNNFSKVTYADAQFKAHPVDLTDLESVRSTLEGVLGQEQRLDLLVHALDVTPGAAFEKLPVGNLEAVLKIGLLGPVLLSRLALPNLLRFRGQLINVIPANKSGQMASALNALIEGGLREMNRVLFESGRDAGLRITNCVLRQNPALSGARVSDAVLEQSHIDLDDVARCIEQLIDPKAVNVPSEVVLYPRLSAAAEKALPETPLPLDPYAGVVLPPKEYNPPQEAKIPTASKQQIERTIPYTDEELEDKIAAAIEDFEAHPERYERPEPAPPNRAKDKNEPQQNQGQGQDPGHGQGQSKNKRRRRRRGGRNRDRSPQQGQGPGQETREGEVRRESPNQERDQARPATSDSADSHASGKSRGNRSRSQPDRERTAGAKPEKETSQKPVKKRAAKKVSKQAADKPADGPPADGAPAKKAVKKSARKGVKKAAKKAAKKAVKKKVAKKKALKSPTGTESA